MDTLDDLLIKRRRGALSEADARRLRSGLRASPEHELSQLAGDVFERDGAAQAGDAELLQRVVAGAAQRAHGGVRRLHWPRPVRVLVVAPLFVAAAAAASVGGYRALEALRAAPSAHGADTEPARARGHRTPRVATAMLAEAPAQAQTAKGDAPEPGSVDPAASASASAVSAVASARPTGAALAPAATDSTSAHAARAATTPAFVATTTAPTTTAAMTAATSSPATATAPTPSAAVAPSVSARARLARSDGPASSVPTLPAAWAETAFAAPEPSAPATPVATRAPGRPAARASVLTRRAAPRRVPTSVATEPGATLQPAPEAAGSASAADLFQRANALRRTDWSAAAATYVELIQRHPRSTEAGVAEVALGKWSLSLGRAGDALDWFRAHQRRGDGPLAAEALWGEAQALESIGSHAAARLPWQRLLERYPDSPYARVARERLSHAE